MDWSKNFYKASIAFLMLVALNLNVNAKEITYSSKLSVGQVESGATLSVVDPYYSEMDNNFNWRANFNNVEVENRIILSINAKHERYQPESYQADVTIQINHEVYENGAFTLVQTNKTLSVTFNRNGAYKGKAVAILKGGHLLDVTILSVTPSNSSKVMNLELEAQIYVERYENINVQTIPEIEHNVQYVNSRNELEVSWDTIAGAEEYELEWTYVNNVSPNGTYLPANQVEIDNEVFRSNNTRVSLKDFSEHGGSKVSYRIPLIYEQGFILYRVRAVGVDFNNYERILAGRWSSDLSNYSNVEQFKNSSTNKNNWYFLASGHQERLNWQSSVTFIEDGKNKIAVSYADGTLRSRQQVSRLNHEDETVIGETVYDHQGRKAIDIIPAPSGRTKIEFVPYFNIDSMSKSYSRTNFDLDTDDECNLNADPVSAESGAGNYYSPANFQVQGQEAFIPDAEGYPFIQTVYTNDNTGRISAQSGIGKDHQIGSGHETKNYYGKPLQVEIDRMFGSEAGLASHYQKNIVVDPNGQVTISYLDLQGNVVATSLAGRTPESLDSLKSNNKIYISEDLLAIDYDKNGNEISKQWITNNGKSKVFNPEILVSTEGERTFEYELIPEKLEIDLNCEEGQVVEQFCFDCVLNVDFMVIDKCGKEMFLDGGVKGKVVGEEILTELEDSNFIDIQNCSRIIHPYTYTNSTKSLKVGDYTIRKVLTINEAALDAYTEEFLGSECLKGFEAFRNENEAEVDTTGCATDCDLCLDNLGEFDQYDINANPDCAPCLSYNEYLSRKEACDEICEDEPTNCLSKLNLMKMDVAPLGQYGEFNDSVLQVNSDTFLLSVYNIDNRLPSNVGPTSGGLYSADLESGGASWKNPVHYEKGNGYYNADGNVAKVEVIYIGNGAFDPPVDNTVSIPSNIEVDDIIEINPQQLLNISDFVANWPADNSWSESLIIYHPEYGGYEYCISNMASHKFDRALQSSQSMVEFIEKYNDEFDTNVDLTGTYSLLLNPLSAQASTSFDPYFNSSSPNFKSIEYDVMEYYLANYKELDGDAVSMLEFAYVTTMCPEAGTYACDSACTDDLDESNVSDEVWATFKAFYIAEKNKLQDLKREVASIAQGFYCGCIGNENWSYSSDNFGRYTLPSNTPYVIRGGGTYTGGGTLSQIYNAYQPCSWFRYQLFRDKQKVFPNISDAMNDEFSESVECYLTSSEVANVPERFYPSTICNERDTAMIVAMRNNALESYVNTCGECPVTSDFETLLNVIVTDTTYDLTSQNIPFGCYPFGLPGWTSLINQASGFSGDDIKFSGYTDGNGDLIGLFFSDSNDSLEVKLGFKDQYVIDDYSNGEEVVYQPSIDEITGLCCVAFEETPQLFSSAEGENFKISATIQFTQSDSSVRNVKLPMEGVVDFMDFENCAFSSCGVTQVGKDLKDFFNMLTFFAIDTGQSQTSGYFTSTTPVHFSETENFEDFLIISDNLKENGPGGGSNITRWEWKQTSIVGDSMTASIKAFSGVSGSFQEQGNLQLSFVPFGNNTINFNQIIRVLSIEPLTGPNNDENYDFFITVEIYDGTGFSYEKLKVSQLFNVFETGYCKEYSRQTSAP